MLYSGCLCAFDNIRLYKQIRILRLLVSEYGIVSYSTSTSPSDLSPRFGRENTVAIFWDLDSKPPKSITAFDAALGLKKMAQNLGFVNYMIAYGSDRALSYFPPPVGAEKKSMNRQEAYGFVKPKEPYICGVCGRRFYTDDKLMNHFKKIHESEHTKRLNQIESARGMRRVNLVGKYSMKMDKYRKAAKNMLIPKIGYGLAEELTEAGFLVRRLSEKAHASIRSEMVDMMERRMINCLVLASDDSEFVGLLKEGGFRTVVVGDTNNGELKRRGTAVFSWQEVMTGHARKEALSVVGKWKEQAVLKSLEWTYDAEAGKNLYRRQVGSEESSSDYASCSTPWWKLEPDKH